MELATFQLKLSGGLTDRHEMEGYDGYNALAGAAFALTLVANYVETGEVRYRGDFKSRHTVHARPMRPGSLIADLSVVLSGDVKAVHGASTGSSTGLLYGLMQRVIGGNIGVETPPLNPETTSVLKTKGGNIEALVSATEPSLRRAHEVIGASASSLEWTGGFNAIGHLDATSKAYMKDTIPEAVLMHKDVAVSGFLGNSGRGLVFDTDLQRNVSVTMTRDTLAAVGTVFSYGLDQYMRRTGNLIRIGYTRMLSSDRRPKRYVIKEARVTRMVSAANP